MLRHMRHVTLQCFEFPVRGTLNNQFTGRWIGRRGTTECPVHDLCWAQEESTNKKPRTFDKQEQQIRDTFVALPLKVLKKIPSLCLQACSSVSIMLGVVLRLYAKWCCMGFKMV